MKKGFSLIEVLVALFIIMVMFVGVIKISILSLRANAYAEAVTYASVLGHTKLYSLKSQGFDSEGLTLEWHMDPMNPIFCNNIKFYRFWQVDKVPAGKRVEMYTAWIDPLRGDQKMLMSESNVRSGLYPRISLIDIFLEE